MRSLRRAGAIVCNYKLTMKECHICDRIYRTERTLPCRTCKRTLCLPCLRKHFPAHADPAPHPSTSSCLLCQGLCKCRKCSPTSLFFSLPQPAQGDLRMDSQGMVEGGLFRGQSLFDMPQHLKRIYLLKKALYTSHEISKHPSHPALDLAQDMTPAPPAMMDVEPMSKQPLDQPQGEDEEQVEDFESEFPERRREHLAKNAEAQESIANGPSGERMEAEEDEEEGQEGEEGEEEDGEGEEGEQGEEGEEGEGEDGSSQEDVQQGEQNNEQGEYASRSGNSAMESEPKQGQQDNQ